MCVATSPQEALGRVCVCAEGWGGALCEVDLQHCTNITYGKEDTVGGAVEGGVHPGGGWVSMCGEGRWNELCLSGPC